LTQALEPKPLHAIMLEDDLFLETDVNKHCQYVYTGIGFTAILVLGLSFPNPFIVIPLAFLFVVTCSCIFDTGASVLASFLASTLIIYLFNWSIFESTSEYIKQISEAVLASALFFGVSFLIQYIKKDKVKKAIWRQSQKQILSAFEGLENCTAVCIDDDLKIITWGKGAEKILQYSASEAVGSNWHKLFTGEDIRANIPEKITRHAKQTGVWTGDLWRVKKTGSRFWGNVILVRLKVGFMCIVKDATSQKRNEESLERWKHIFNHGGWCVVVTDAKTNLITHVNNAFVETHGYSSTEELTGKPMSVFFAPEFISDFPKHLQIANQQSDDYVCETVHIKKDGTRFPVRTHMSLFRDEQGKPIYRVAICQDITNQRKMEKVLRHKTEELRQSNEQKDAFFATLSHELRNPLQPIKTALHLYEQTGATDIKMMELITRNINQIQKHVDDLMDVARIGKGKIQLDKSIVDIRDILHVAVEQIHPLIKAKNQKLYTSIPTEPVYISADPTRLQQIITNLLNNAAKYTEERGIIWITAELTEGYASVKIKDTGIGISKDMQSRIFDLYAQAKPNQGGLGLGLTLVKSLVELHDGKIEVQSDTGKGSTFIVKLPITESETPVVDVDTEVIDNNSINNRKILVVDDNVDAAISLQMMFAMEGCDVTVAHDGKEALEAYGKFHPDIVLLDIGLPKVNGYEVAQQIRKTDQRVVLIAVTGYGQPSDKQQATESGFDAHVVKPVEPDLFKQLVNSLFESRSPRDDSNVGKISA
jgi:PAS domain S-box-containing protein